MSSFSDFIYKQWREIALLGKWDLQQTDKALDGLPISYGQQQLTLSFTYFGQE